MPSGTPMVTQGPGRAGKSGMYPVFTQMHLSQAPAASIWLQNGLIGQEKKALFFSDVFNVFLI